MIDPQSFHAILAAVYRLKLNLENLYLGKGFSDRYRALAKFKEVMITN